MKALVIGPGAIGCALGAAMTSAGVEVSFFGRAPFDRLAVHHLDGTIEARAVVLTETSSIPAVDLVVLATKANQVDAVGPALSAATATCAPVVVAQNGIEHPARVQPHVAAEVPIVSSVVSLPAHRLGPGRVEVTGSARLAIGPPDDLDPATSTLIEAAFADSFVRVLAPDDFVTAQWLKLAANASLGAVGVLVRRDNSYLLDPDGRELTRRAIAEIVPVARAEGADLPADLADRMVDDILERAGGHTSSIVADRLADQPSEWRERNHVISRLGRVHGLATPLNDLCTSLIRLGEPDHPPPP